MRDPGAAWGPVGGRSTNPAAAGLVSESPNARVPHSAVAGIAWAENGRRDQNSSWGEEAEGGGGRDAGEAEEAKRDGMEDWWPESTTARRHADISVWTLGGWLASQLQLAVGSRLEACLASRQRAGASVNSLAW